ncbi:MAG: hypothetical protein ABIJ21_00840 [Nanoarchaeota archaeon]
MNAQELYQSMEHLRELEKEIKNIQSKPSWKINTADLEKTMATFGQEYGHVTRALSSMNPEQFREYHAFIQSEIERWRNQYIEADEKAKKLESEMEKREREHKDRLFFTATYNAHMS